MFKPRSRSTSIALFAIAGLSSAAAHAQYVVNGSFESVAGVVPANGFLTRRRVDGADRLDDRRSRPRRKFDRRGR